MTEKMRHQPNPESRVTWENVLEPASGLTIREIFSEHNFYNTLHEAGDFQALAVEDFSPIYGKKGLVSGIHNLADTVGDSGGQYQYLFQKAKENGLPIYYTDCFLPREIVEDERSEAIHKVYAGMGVAVSSVIGMKMIEKAIENRMSRRAFLKSTLKNAAGLVGLTGMVGGMTPIVELATRHPDGDLHEGSVQRSINRATGTIQEEIGLEARKLTLTFRNLVMAYKIKYVAGLCKASGDTRHIAAPVGYSHHRLGERIGSSVEVLEKEIRRWIREYEIPQEVVRSIAYIPEMKYDKNAQMWTDTVHTLPAFKDLIQ